MDRRLSYIDANPDILDLLLNARFAMEGLAKVSEAVFGQNSVVAGFTCTPTSPASMTVNVGPGMVYQMAALESAAISALNADTHQVLKQGLSREITPLTLVAPTTVGTAVNVLIEVAYSDDKSTTQQVFNYYNAANPDVPLTGVGGNNLPQTSVIKGVAQIQTKYGIPATSGSQTTPTADPGFAPLFVVTLTQGQTAISGNIAVATGAPFVADALQNIPAGVQANRYTYVKDTGVANALVVAPVPALAARPEGTELTVLPKFTSTTTSPTINDGLGTVALLKRDGSAPAAGDIAAGNRFRIIFDGAAYRLAGPALSDGASTSNATPIAQAAKAIFNVQQFNTSTRVPLSQSGVGAVAVGWTGFSYAKKSPTSLVLVWAEFMCRTASSNGPTLFHLNFGANAYEITASNAIPGTAIKNTIVRTLGTKASPLAAATYNCSLDFYRNDATAWTTVFNPNNTDESGYASVPVATLVFAEVEPT
ncbi:hypothetical protein ACLBYG_22490 [Methylobacterium sp. D53M]